MSMRSRETKASTVSQSSGAVTAFSRRHVAVLAARLRRDMRNWLHEDVYGVTLNGGGVQGCASWAIGALHPKS